MSLLSRIFSKNGSHSTDMGGTTQLNKSVDQVLDVSEDLFLNNTPTRPKTEIKSEKNILQQFLDRDYFVEGYDAGYKWHSNEILENRIKQFKAEYRYNLDIRIDSINKEITDLENHRANIKDMSHLLEVQLDNQINATKKVLSKVMQEKELSAQDEGLVMTCIHKYKQGFLQGTNAFLEENIIASTTGLFN